MPGQRLTELCFYYFLNRCIKSRLFILSLCVKTQMLLIFFCINTRLYSTVICIRLQFKMVFQAVILLAVVVADISAAVGPCKYLKFTPYHTYCKEKNPICKFLKSGLSYEEKVKIVELHNEFRSKVALGQESRGGGLPQAANMLEMVRISAIFSYFNFYLF